MPVTRGDLAEAVKAAIHDELADLQPPSTGGRSGEFLRWIVSIVLAGIVAYFSALGAMQAQIAVITERENNHYHELIKRLDRIESGLYGVGAPR